MHIITRSAAAVESKDWQQILSESIRDPKELLLRLGLQEKDVPDVDLDNSFSMLVPQPFIQQMAYADAHDPLLRQVLPVLSEREVVAGFSVDPLGERNTNVQTGIVHKYNGRLLLMLASSCAVNCRYCFRRHFPYSDNRLGKKNWQHTLSYLQQHQDVKEVILSGGDPLLVSDERLQDIIKSLDTIGHIKRLRIHTRLPVVIPQRLTQKLKNILNTSKLQSSLVIHCNHKNEISHELQSALLEFKHSGITLLNQSVLLKGVNDDAQTLIELSDTLFSVGVLPYYLHLLDLIQGGAHFNIEHHQALDIYQKMQQQLPGYLLPKLARECAGEMQKTVVVPS